MADSQTKRLHIQYYALLREERGLSAEMLETPAVTLRGLYEALRMAHGFSLPSERLRVSVNEAFSDWNSPLEAGDRVVFIPPVAGG